MLPSIVHRTFTIDNAVSNGVWGFVYLGVYAGISALVPVILHGVTRLSWPWLAVLGFGMFCLLSAGTLAWWAHRSISGAPSRVVSADPLLVQPAEPAEFVSPLPITTLEEAAELGERCASAGKDIYAFLTKHAARTDEANVLAEYRHEFAARVSGLYQDIFAGGMSPPDHLGAPVMSRDDIHWNAHTLTIRGEGYSAERLAKLHARALKENQAREDEEK